MRVNNIVSQRLYQTWPSWHLIYEWEDVFKNTLKLNLLNEPKLVQNYIVSRIPFLYDIVTNNFDNSLFFELFAQLNRNARNQKNMIPCIVDFYVKKERFSLFEKAHSNNKVVFVSSREAYYYLLDNNCNLNIKHLPLSLPDKYKINFDTRYEKLYDVVMVGRQNPILKEMLMRYADDNPRFDFVYEKQVGPKFHYYTRGGSFVGIFDSRKKYFDLLRKARVVLYSTPGIDGGEDRTHGFNQVTPKFLEMVSAGCHILARYVDNPDTEYYELNKICKHISNYNDFKLEMERCLNEDVNMDLYSNYLSKHYTSERAKLFLNVVTDI